jgi:hypothetical protein
MTMPDWLFISLFQNLTEGVLQIKSWIKEFFGIFWHLINTHTHTHTSTRKRFHSSLLTWPFVH